MIVGPLPVRTVSYEDHVKDWGNGKIPLENLVVIGDRGWLFGNAARAYNALAFMCLSIGLPLTYTFGGTNRTYADQLNLWYQRMVTEKTPWGIDKATGQPIFKTKVWNGVTWYLKAGLAGCAIPGTSNHGWAIAIDTAFDPYPFDADGISPADAEAITSHPQWPKFKEFAEACGFSWEDTSEPWHIRYCLGNAVSQLILDVEAMIAGAGHAPATVPSPSPSNETSEEVDVFKSVIMVKGRPETAALVVIGEHVPHMSGVGNGTLAAAEALRVCGQNAPAPVERAFYVDIQTKSLRGAGYTEAEINAFTGGVPQDA